MAKKPTKQKTNKMPKHELVRAFSKRLDVSQDIASFTIEILQDTILEALKQYDEVKVGDLVVIKNQVKPETKRILNGEEITTPGYKGLKASITTKYKKM